MLKGRSPLVHFLDVYPINKVSYRRGPQRLPPRSRAILVGLQQTPVVTRLVFWHLSQTQPSGFGGWGGIDAKRLWHNYVRVWSPSSHCQVCIMYHPASPCSATPGAHGGTIRKKSRDPPPIVVCSSPSQASLDNRNCRSFESQDMMSASANHE